MIKLTWNDSAARLSSLMKPALDTNWGNVDSIVPPGYNRYLRIFNFARDKNNILFKWTDVAAALGKPVTADSQWDRDFLPDAHEELGLTDPWLSEPDAELLQALGEILLRHEPEEREWQFSSSWIYGDVNDPPEGSITVFPTGYEMITYKGSVRDESGDFVLPYLNAEGSWKGRLPMYLWPESLEWVVGQALYGRSVYLACSNEIAEEILTDPRLDTIEVNSWDVAELED